MPFHVANARGPQTEARPAPSGDRARGAARLERSRPPAERSDAGRRNGDAPASDPGLADRLFAEWARLGVGFAAAPAAATPDLERLIIDTVRHGRDHARLLVMAATWLRVYGSLVARHRLAQLAVTELGATERSILGWLLDEATRAPAEAAVVEPGAGNVASAAEPGGRALVEARGRVRFREVLAVCRPAARAQPVFRVHERHAALQERLDRAASPSARRWNLLAEALHPKFDSLRAASWLLAANPSLALRALLGGDLRASILAAIERDEAAGASELELARRCGASRAAVRDALARLSLAGMIARSSVGRRRPIRLVHAA